MRKESERDRRRGKNVHLKNVGFWNILNLGEIATI